MTHARRSFVVVVTLCSLLTPACLLAQAALSEGSRGRPAKNLANVAISGSRVDWLPQIDYEHLVLTVAGPKDLYIRQEFGAGQPPALELFDSGGNPLPEGIYSYELWITPRQKAESSLPLRYSGYLAVRGGSFVTMDSPSSMKPVSRSPVKPVTAEQIIAEGVCIGDLCGTGDEGQPLTLKDDAPQLVLDGDTPNIYFKDDTPGGASADHSWVLQANEPFNAAEFLALWDVDAYRKVLTIEGDAPEASLYMRSNGNIGIGTSSPGTPLHVSRSTGATLEGIRLTNNNEARITIENTTQSTKYIMGVNNTNPALFFISRDGGGGTIVEVNQRLDAGGVASLKVNGSVAATNVVFSSSRDLKRNVKELDPQALLAQVARLPISEWSFKDGSEQVRHIGPMAEDFHAVFGLSQNHDTISVTDTTGVALAAIQALLQRVEDLEMRNADLTERLLALESPRLESPDQH